MAKGDDIKDPKDAGAALTPDMQRFLKSLQNAENSVDSIKAVMNSLLEPGGALADQYENIDELMQGILTDSKKMQAFQMSVNNLLDQERRTWMRKLATQKASTETLRYYDDMWKDIIGDSKEGLAILISQTKEYKTQQVHLANINDKMKALAGYIRNPASLAESMLQKLGGIPGHLAKAANEGKGLGAGFKDIAKTLGTKIGKYAKFLFSPTGLFIAGVAAATAAVFALVALFKNFWTWLDKKILPATAMFNKEIGGVGENLSELRSQAHAAGQQFQDLGYTWAEGEKVVRDLAMGMKTVKLDPETLKTGKELISVLGLSGEQAGKLALQFTKQTGNLDQLNKMMNVGRAEAEAYGLVPNQVLKDMAAAPEVLARFGTRNSMEFARSTAAAQSYGLTIKDVNSAFGEQLDTFEGSADAAAKLNAIFGTQINSMELMLETDPTKRMEMLRGELLRQGKTWEDLNTFEQNVITSTLNVDKSQAALILSSEKQRKILEAQAREKQKQIDINEKWNKGIGSIKQTMLAWQSILDELMRAITRLVGSILGFKDPAMSMIELANKIQASVKGLTGWINSLTEKLNDNNSSLSRWMRLGKAMFKLSVKFNPVLKIMGHMLKTVADATKALFRIMDRMAQSSAFQSFTKAMEALASPGLAGKALRKIAGVGEELVPTRAKAEAIATKTKKTVISPVVESGQNQAKMIARELANIRNEAGERLENIQVNLILDGKKIAESMVRNSRK
jgi:hypothetical protein